jgi:hypothetical protein
MKIRVFARQFPQLVIVLALVGSCSWRAAAQNEHPHAATASNQNDHNRQAGALLQVVREATERFKDVEVAKAEGYGLVFGCVTGPDAGAMGMHFLKPSLLTTNLDARQPQIVIYEPQPDGTLKLVGADFLVFAKDWDALHPGDPPQLMGQLFHFFDKPNRFGLEPFYTLHVWAWKDNPNGAFVNWHPNIDCQWFAGQ